MVGVGGVHPPAVHAHPVELREVFPVDVACLFRVAVIHTHARGIVGPRRPLWQARLRPCVEMEQQLLVGKFLVGLGVGAKGGPDAQFQVGSLAVHLVNHALGVTEVGVDELHGIPVVVAAPVLPVLDDAVEGHTRLPVGAEHLQQFVLRLVAFAALVEAVGPQRQHGHLARQVAHLADDTICIAAIHEIVVHALSHLAFQCKHLVVADHGGGVVVPVHAVALDALEEMGIVLQIGLLHLAVLAAQVHLSVLHHAQAVDGFVGVQHKGLAHLIVPLVYAFRDGPKAVAAFGQQRAAVGCKERDLLQLAVYDNGQLFGLVGTHVAFVGDGNGHLAGLGRYHQTLSVGHCAVRRFHYVHDGGREELDFLGRGGHCEECGHG